MNVFKYSILLCVFTLILNYSSEISAQETKKTTSNPEVKQESEDQLWLQQAKKLFYAKGENKDLKSAFELFQKAAKQNNSEALFWLGRCYENGWGMFECPEKAFESYEKAAKRGNPEAITAKAKCYYYGYGVKQNQKEGLRLMQEAIDQGNTSAMLARNEIYWDEIYSKPGSDETFTLFQSEVLPLLEKAVELGNEKACWILFGLTRKNVEIERNHAKFNLPIDEERIAMGVARGNILLNKLQEMDSPYLLLCSAEAYKKGFCREKDAKECISLYEQALVLSEEYQEIRGEAAINLFFIYSDGIEGVKKNPTLARTYLELAVQFEQPMALCLWGEQMCALSNPSDYEKGYKALSAAVKARIPLAYLYKGRRDVRHPATVKTGIELLKKACQYNPDAYYPLIGALFLTNEKEEAIEYVKQGAEKRIPLCCGLLAEVYLQGGYVEKNYDEAFRLASIAAEKKNDKGMLILAWCYLHGWGTEKDLNKMIKILETSLYAGNASAALVLGRCYLEGVGVNRDEKKALDLFTKATGYAATENLRADAQLMAALCLLEGVGVEKDESDAVRRLTAMLNSNYDSLKSHAYYTLACCYKTGRGVKKDELRARQFLNASALYPDVLCILEACHFERFEGKTVLRSLIEGKHHVDSSEDELSQLKSIALYSFSIESAPDACDCLDEQLRSYDSADALLMRGLIQLYLNDKSANAKAETYLRQSAEKGNATALFFFGYCKNLQNNIVDNGIYEIKQAAEQGVIFAQVCLCKILIQNRNLDEVYKTIKDTYTLDTTLTVYFAYCLYMGYKDENGNRVQDEKKSEELIDRALEYDLPKVKRVFNELSTNRLYNGIK